MNQQNPDLLKFKVKNLRRIPNPYGEFQQGTSQRAPEMFEVLVNAQDVPENINLKTNPRFQNMKTKTVARIKEGLLTDNRSFHILNRGIAISAKEVKFDNVNGEISVLLDDDDVHGCIDGGHTYNVVITNRDKMDHVQFVKMEFLTGIESIFEDVAAARNTSVQVRENAIAELKGKFDFLKDFIKNEPFANDIAYKENDDKDIDIKEILSILYMFNLDMYPDRQSVPVKAFNSQHSCLKDYLKAHDDNEGSGQITNPYYKMKNIIVDIFQLHDEIELHIGDKYKEFFGSGRYGATKGVVSGKTKTKFYKYDSDYKTPKGFIYPILGSFRALLKEENGFYEWKADPFKYFDEIIGKDLVGETVERSRTLGNNPGSVGKDSGHWKSLYRNVLTNYLLENQEE